MDRGAWWAAVHRVAEMTEQLILTQKFLGRSIQLLAFPAGSDGKNLPVMRKAWV